MDMSVDVLMALPSWPCTRAWGVGGAPSAKRHRLTCGHCLCCRSVTLLALATGEAQGILPSIDVMEGKDLFFNHGPVISEKSGVQEVGRGLSAPGVWEGTMGPVCSSTPQLLSERSSEGFSARFYSPAWV